MKYGIIYHRYTQNIGDDIQSYAAMRFLPRIDYMIDREKIADFKSDDGEPVAALFAHWWKWKKFDWPPSDIIHPLLAGFHVTNRPIELGGSPLWDEMFRGVGGQYLKDHGPVGCRDMQAVELMDSVGVPNYFSGCITLTLDRIEGPAAAAPEKPYVCLVDIDKRMTEVIKKQLEGTGLSIKRITHSINYRDNDLSWERRTRRVERLLAIYQNAHCVISNRLHVMLPCLALGTPFYHRIDDITAGRKKPYVDWTPRISTQEVLEGKARDFLVDPRPNPTHYLKYRDKLIADIESFVAGAEAIGGAAELRRPSYTDEEKRDWQFDLYKYTLNKWVDENKRNVQIDIRMKKFATEPQYEDARRIFEMVNAKNLKKVILLYWRLRTLPVAGPLLRKMKVFSVRKAGAPEGIGSDGPDD
jgi:hypothetical protein